MNKKVIAGVIILSILIISMGAKPQNKNVTAVASAFGSEMKLLLANARISKTTTINGTTFYEGKLAGKQVVMYLSGVSMVNAAMTTQLLLDKYQVRQIVFSGIAGGVSPDLNVGDITVPEKWIQFQENYLGRKQADGTFTIPSYDDPVNYPFPNYLMAFPQPVRPPIDTKDRWWFEANTALLNVAKSIHPELDKCTLANVCLDIQPKFVVGGNGGSSQSFVDNKEYREYLYNTFQLQALDMESAALAHVAYTNGVPFIIFRSLSDLAGGGPGENEIGTFFQLAADNSATAMMNFLEALK